MSTLGDIRSTRRREKLFFLRYTLAIAIELAVAFWLLSLATGEFAWLAWIAYLVLASAAFATFVGLLWFSLWIAEQGVGVRWYLAAILSVTASLVLINWQAIVDLWHRLIGALHIG